MYFNSFLLSVIVSFLWFDFSSVNCQDFCHSYEANSGKAVMFSPDRQNLFIVINDKFWIVNEKGNQLAFKGDNRQAVNTSKLLGNRISTLFIIETKDDDLGDFIGFYDMDRKGSNNPFGWMTYTTASANFFDRCQQTTGEEDKRCGQYMLEQNLDMDDIKESINAYETGFDIKYNIMLVQSAQSAQSANNFTRKMLSVRAEASNWNVHTPDSFIRVNFSREYKDKQPSTDFDKIAKLNASLHVIGIFKTFGKLFVILKFDNSIKYCGINDCFRNLFQPLIDCKTNYTFATTPTQTDTSPASTTASSKTTTTTPSNTGSRPTLVPPIPPKPTNSNDITTSSHSSTTVAQKTTALSTDNTSSDTTITSSNDTTATSTMTSSTDTTTSSTEVHLTTSSDDTTTNTEMTTSTLSPAISSSSSQTDITITTTVEADITTGSKKPPIDETTRTSHTETTTASIKTTAPYEPRIQPVFVILALIGAFVAATLVILILMAIAYFCTDKTEPGNKWDDGTNKNASKSENEMSIPDSPPIRYNIEDVVVPEETPTPREAKDLKTNSDATIVVKDRFSDNVDNRTDEEL